MADFAFELCWGERHHGCGNPDYDTFKRVFSVATPSDADINKVRKLMDAYIQENKISDEKSQQLYFYLDHLNEHPLQTLDIEQLSPLTFGIGGEIKLPEISCFKYLLIRIVNLIQSIFNRLLFCCCKAEDKVLAS